MIQAVLSVIEHPLSIPNISTIFSEYNDIRSFQDGKVLFWATIPKLPDATLNNKLTHQTGHYSSVIPATQSNIDCDGKAGFTTSPKNFIFSGLVRPFHCAPTSGVFNVSCTQQPQKSKSANLNAKETANLCGRHLKSVVSGCPPLPLRKACVPISNLQTHFLGHDKIVNYQVSDASMLLSMWIASVCSAINWHASTQRTGQWPGALSRTKLRHPKLLE